MFNWQPFTEVDSSFAAKITVRATGQFGFTLGAVNKFEIPKYPFAHLYFDVGRRAIGIELCQNTAVGAIEIKSSPTNTYLRAKNFCDRHGIDYSKSQRYALSRDDTSGFLYFLLDEGEEAADGDSEGRESQEEV